MPPGSVWMSDHPYTFFFVVLVEPIPDGWYLDTSDGSIHPFFAKSYRALNSTRIA